MLSDMARRAAWSDLRTGIAAIAAVLGLAAFILVFGSVGSLHGATFSLYVLTDEARGVIRGTEVWLDGQKVGLVKGVGFLPSTMGGQARAVMRLDVLSSTRQHIRLDSRARIRSGGSLISTPVVWINTGTARARAVVDGDTLRGFGQTDFESATAQLAMAAKELPAIAADARALTAQLITARGNFGSVLSEVGPRLRTLSKTSSGLMNQFSTSGGGWVATLRGQDAFGARVQRALAAVDSVGTLLSSERSSLGRFRKDSSLAQTVASLRHELGALRAIADNPDGTIGRLRSDSAVRQSLDAVYRQIDSLAADLRKHPLRYIPF